MDIATERDKKTNNGFKRSKKSKLVPLDHDLWILISWHINIVLIIKQLPTMHIKSIDYWSSFETHNTKQ